TRMNGRASATRRRPADPRSLRVEIQHQLQQGRDAEKIHRNGRPSFDKTSACLGGLSIFAALAKVATAQTSTPSLGAAGSGAQLIAVGLMEGRASLLSG